jgi:VHL beta domain
LQPAGADRGAQAGQQPFSEGSGGGIFVFRGGDRLPLGQIETLRSGPGTAATTIEFWNKTDETVKVYWIDPDGEFKGYRTVNAYRIKTERTFVSHLWVVEKDERHPLALVNATPGLTIGTIN